jgi:hypothetical protein
LNTTDDEGLDEAAFELVDEIPNLILAGLLHDLGDDFAFQRFGFDLSRDLKRKKQKNS